MNLLFRFGNNKMFLVFRFALVVLYILHFLHYYFYDRKRWDVFTRLISTVNAFQCLFILYFLRDFNMLTDIHKEFDPYIISSLEFLSAYLFVDGAFQILDLFFFFSFGSLLSVLHHLVGGYGIYLIASEKTCVFLGIYFALTEISTPFYHLSWYFRNRKTLILFYIFFTFSRILTIPILLKYLSNNYLAISSLDNEIYQLMGLYASYVLIGLNSLWFLFLTKKVISR